MLVRDLVSFNKEAFFNGAVQTEWFYDVNRVKLIAESYVFHGPKYYGVSEKDVVSNAHKLIDTASFAKNITEKLYTSKPNNSFVMTIAGYGTGKSHLAVCLAALFSGEPEIVNNVTENIEKADPDIGAYIREYNTRKNLVIVLNGMNNFNLDAEVLRCARIALARNGLDDTILRKLTKSYDIARHFVSHSFEFGQKQFEATARQFDLNLVGQTLKNYLLQKVETDSTVISIINSVYAELNGDSISWDRGLSAGDVLQTLQAELCGAGKPFNKLLVLFDEFGRYIEYTAANPAVAGDAALQQIFESVQNADGKIVFAAFIQSELKAYLARIDKTANVTRYIDRYRTASENLYLSSNFETILANVLKKKQPMFDNMIPTHLEHLKNRNSTIQAALNRWDRSAIKKSVWTTEDLYNTVILQGCYPVHPITVWLLSGSHQWMQQRSTLAFASEMFDSIADTNMDDFRLPYIYPVSIVDSSIYNEMLNSEEKGLVPSQYCMLYRDIIVKIGDKLSDLEYTVLKAILVMNMGRMKFFNKDDAITGISLCSALSVKEIIAALKTLEELHGVIAYDEHANTFDLIAEANGFNEFKRAFSRYRIGTKASIADIDEDLSKALDLNTPVETSFGQEHHIASTEWAFSKYLIESTDITKTYLENLVRKIEANIAGEEPRGILLFAYCHTNTDQEVARMATLYQMLELEKYPILLLLVDDTEADMLGALGTKKILQKFSAVDRERFKKHIADQKHTANNRFTRKFTQALSRRLLINSLGMVSYEGRLHTLCTRCFESLYSKAVPFPFDGFENKKKDQAKATLSNLCVSLYTRTLLNIQVYSAFPSKDKNRVSTVLSTSAPFSWKVYTDHCELVEPQNSIVNEMFQDVVRALADQKRHSVFQLFGKFAAPPYGMNENSIALFATYFMAVKENQYLYFLGNERLSADLWSSAVIPKGKLKFSELSKINVQKNLNIDVDVVAECCKKIVANILPDQCTILKAELEGLIQQEGITEANRYRVAHAQAYLEEGIRLSTQIDHKISQAITVINEAKEKFSITKFYRVFDMLPVITPVVEDGSQYVYSDRQKQSIARLKGSISEVLNKKYMATLARSRCKITELSQFKAIYKRAAQSMRDNGYEEYADATLQRITEVEKELISKQRYENVLVDCNKDLLLCESATKYRECAQLQEKLSKWLSFLNGASDLASSISKPLIDKISGAIENLKSVQESILQEFEETFEDLSYAKTKEALNQVTRKLDVLYASQLPSDKAIQIVSAKEDISNALVEIDLLPCSIDLLTERIDSGSMENNKLCAKVIRRAAEIKRSEYEEIQASWVARFITPLEYGCDSMSTFECSNWLTSTEHIPDYFSMQIVNQFKDARTEIERQLHKSRVDGVLTLYRKLSAAEKEEVKKAILGF